MNLWIVTGEGVSSRGTKALVQTDMGALPGIQVYRCDEINYLVETGMPPILFYQNTPVSTPDIYMLLGDYDERMDALAAQLDALGAVAYNNIAAKRISMSKIATAQTLAAAGLPVARTMPLQPGITKEAVLAQFSLPMVVKPDTGFGGSGVRLIHTEEELEALLASLPKEELLLAQEYISASKGRDVRVVMLHHKAIHAIMRQASNPEEFRSNVKVGAEVLPFEMTDEIRDLCETASRAIGLDHCGFDLLFTQNGFLIGEVNATPGFQSWHGKIDLAKMMIADAKRKYKEAKGIDL